MKVTDDTPRRLAFTLGVPWFNGCRCAFDKDEGLARIETTNLFWRSKPRVVPLDDIVAIDTVRMETPRVGGQMASHVTYPQITLRSGATIALPSAGVAEDAVQKIYAFLSAEPDAERGAAAPDTIREEQP